MPSSKVQWVARAGYCARGIVFFLVGGLAFFSGLSTNKSDTRTALDVLLGQPLGRIWVSAIALGLLGFIAWRLAQSLGNADRHESDMKGVAIRLALFGSAITYMGLAFYAIGLVVGPPGSDSTSGEKGLAAWTMAQPFGKYLVGAIGLGFIAGGIVTAAKGILGKYERYLSAQALDSQLIKGASVYGLFARGAVFIVVGAFLAYAGIKVNPQEAGNIGDALAWIRNQPFGRFLYAATALGLASFGAYNVILARYRIVRHPRLDKHAKAALRSSARLLDDTSRR